MSDLQLTRVETDLPGADPDTDWSIRCNGKLIARTFLIDAGPQTGRWKWSCLWTPSEVGNADSLDDALEEIKARVTADKLTTLALGPAEWKRGFPRQSGTQPL